MIEQLVRGLVENRYRWLIVISVTCGIGLALLLPTVDDYFAGKEEKKDLERELAAAARAAEELDQLQTRLSERAEQLSALQQRTVSENRMSLYRSRLVDLARQTGCQIRRISVGSTYTRPWYQKDDPLVDRVDSNRVGAETGLALRRQPVTLSVSGSMTSLRTLLNAMQQDHMLMHTRSLELRPTGQNRKMVTLDMELWFFDLSTSADVSA